MKRPMQIALCFAPLFFITIFTIGALAIKFPTRTLLGAIILGTSMLAAYGLVLLSDEIASRRG